MPLVPRTYEDYLRDLTAERLNRFNVKYYVIPQLLPVDRPVSYTMFRTPCLLYPSAPGSIYRDPMLLKLQVTEIDIESYLSHAADLPTGYLVAECFLGMSEGMSWSSP